MRGVVISRTLSNSGLATTVFLEERGKFRQARLLDRFGAPIQLSEFRRQDQTEMLAWKSRCQFDVCPLRQSTTRLHAPEDVIVDPLNIRVRLEPLSGVEFRLLVERFAVDEFEVDLPTLHRTQERFLHVAANNLTCSMGFVRCVQVIIEPDEHVLLVTNNRPPVKAHITCETIIRSIKDGILDVGFVFKNALVRFELGNTQRYAANRIMRRYVECAGLIL